MSEKSRVGLAWTQHRPASFTSETRFCGYVQRELRAPTFAHLAFVQVDIPFVCLDHAALGGPGRVSNLQLHPKSQSSPNKKCKSMPKPWSTSWNVLGLGSLDCLIGMGSTSSPSLIGLGAGNEAITSRA